RWRRRCGAGQLSMRRRVRPCKRSTDGASTISMACSGLSAARRTLRKRARKSCIGPLSAMHWPTSHCQKRNRRRFTRSLFGSRCETDTAGKLGLPLDEPRALALQKPHRRPVSLRGKSRLSDVDVERARLLHQYALHCASADAQRLADLQYARATLVEAQDTLFQLSPAHAPALFICVSLAVLLVAAA